jgi:RNA polymerase sigma-B factor
MPMQTCDTDELFLRYRSTGSRVLRNQLVVEHTWLAERCAARFRHRGEPDGDILQVAQLGLVKAVERFDPARGQAFVSFATPTITGEIKRHFRDCTWAVRVPRRSKDLMGTVRAATELLHHRLGRSPTVDEVATEIGVAREDVLDTMEASAVYRSSSLDQPVDPSGRAGSGTIGELFGADDGDLRDADVRIAARLAMSHLDERSRQVLYWRFYEQCTQEEIGERLGMGQVQVSRLLRSLMTKLRRELDVSVS